MRESLRDVFFELVQALEDEKLSIENFMIFYVAIQKLSKDITKQLGEYKSE